MPPQDSLYSIVHAQFHDAFGQPHNVLGGGEQWTLQPATRYRSPIHVLLNGTARGPGVWIFDPHDPATGVVNTPIAEVRQIGQLIKLIQERLNVANRDNSTPQQT